MLVEIEHPVEAPALYVTAPVPLPPDVLKADVLPYTTVEGVAMAVRAAWLALLSVTEYPTDVAAL